MEIVITSFAEYDLHVSGPYQNPWGSPTGRAVCLRRSLSKSGVSLLYENNLAAYCKNMCHCVCDSKRTARREGEREGRKKEGRKPYFASRKLLPFSPPAGPSKKQILKRSRAETGIVGAAGGAGTWQPLTIHVHAVHLLSAERHVCLGEKQVASGRRSPHAEQLRCPQR